MSSGVDTAVTAVGFVILLPAVVFVVATAPMLGMAGDGIGPHSRKLYGYLVLALVIVPPLFLITLYVVALVLACVATGSTFYYPLVALAVGAAAWFGLTSGIGVWIDRVK